MTARTCSVEGCGRPVLARGWCVAHYTRWRRGSDMAAPVDARPVATCSVDGCEVDAVARGMCPRHYERARLGADGAALSAPVVPRAERGPVCMLDGCGRPHRARGWCSLHYSRVISGRPVIPAPPPPRAVRIPRPVPAVPRLRQPRPETCSVAGCERAPDATREMCWPHYQARRRQRLREEARARPAYGSVDGHGRYGMLERDDDGRVICHECGRALEHLATHVRVHGVTASEYRERHGLAPGLALVGETTRARMSAAWERHRDEHAAVLAEHRDPAAATEASRGARWSPQQVAAAQARGAARRGRPLTPEEVASLGDVTDLPVWSARVRALLELDGVTVASVARSLDMPHATVSQRLRRYPRA